jgi:hypothetical protein
VGSNPIRSTQICQRYSCAGVGLCWYRRHVGPIPSPKSITIFKQNEIQDPVAYPGFFLGGGGGSTN